MRFLAILLGLVAATSAAQCGQRGNNPSSIDVNSQNNIIRGNEASPNEFPWQISLQGKTSFQRLQTWRHFCGGSIINDQWVLTAAHCHILDKLELYRVVAGAHNLTKNESTTQIISVEQFITHPGFDIYTMKDDIALIKINKRFKLNNNTVHPICLPTIDDEHTFDKATCVATGWGKTAQNSSVSDILLKANLSVVSNPICVRKFEDIMCARITKNNICGGSRPGRDTCQADSGGAFACSHNGVYKVAGVTSFGVSCGSMEHPVVYTRVWPYLDWIHSVLNAE